MCTQLQEENYNDQIIMNGWKMTKVHMVEANNIEYNHVHATVFSYLVNYYNLLQNVCVCDYYIIHLLCRNYMSLHCSMLSTCIKGTGDSTRYFSWRNNQVACLSGQLETYTTILNNYF